MTFRYVSLFSGAGGLDIGLDRAGFEPLALNEIEPVFCESLRQNQGWRHQDGREYLGSAPILQADIRELSGTDLVGDHDVDLVVGGPPCQAFSSAGKQLSVLDPRGDLVHEYTRIIEELRPKVFLFENVRGLVTARDRTGEPGGVIHGIHNDLQAMGYSCRAALLNSADYGSHQRRVRVFMIGSRSGTAPYFPDPSHCRGGDLFRAQWRTLGEFLESDADQDPRNYVFPRPDLEEALRDLPDGSGIKSPGKAEATRPGGHWGYRQGTFIADQSLPARTVTGSASQDWVRWDGLLRRLTLQEVMGLQGFPADWVLSGSTAQKFKQIGNAVPAIFGELLGSVMAEHLAAFPESPAVPLELPSDFGAAIRYTKKDHARNHASRSVHKHFDQPAEQVS